MRLATEYLHVASPPWLFFASDLSVSNLPTCQQENRFLLDEHENPFLLEDCGHLFFKCEHVHDVWRVLNLDHIRIEQKLWSTSEICSSINYHLMEWEKLKKPIKEKFGGTVMRWKAPPVDNYKLNVDASFLSSGKGGWGYIARDHDGAYLDGGVGNIPRALSVLHVEAIAALRYLKDMRTYMDEMLDSCVQHLPGIESAGRWTVYKMLQDVWIDSPFSNMETQEDCSTSQQRNMSKNELNWRVCHLMTQTPRMMRAVPSTAGPGRTRSPRTAAATAVAAKVTALVTGTATEMGAAPRSAKKDADAHRLAANGAEYCHVRRRASHRPMTLPEGEA
ncbi:hypothetical protein EJB05_18527, partial [Eragrostis curvula]